MKKLKNINLKLFLEIFLASILSYVILCIAYPEYFFFANIRFNSGTDIVHPFLSSFIIVKSIINLDFDLWNIYDQVNYSFTHLTSGIYTFPALIEGLLFFILEPFFENQSTLIHNIHSYFFQYLCIFARSIGIVCILKFYNLNFKFRIFISVIFNTIFSSAITAGIMVAFIYSLVPILIYLVILLFYQKKIDHLISFFLLIAFCFSQAPIFTLGYLFLPFHFIFLILLVIVIFDFYKNPRLIKKKLNFFFTIRSKKTIFLSSFPIFFIILFNYNFFLVLSDTLVLTELNNTQESRLNSVFNVAKYFNAYNADHLNLTFYSDLINFNKFDIPDSGTYIGLISLIIIFLGTFNSKKKEKWIFFGTVTYIVLLLGPRLPINVFHPSFYAHLINSSLNPFSFLVRDPHMTNQFMYMFLLPNFIFGINILLDFANNLKKTEYLYDQILFFTIIVLSFILLNIGNFEILIYLFVSIFLFIFIFLISKNYFLNFGSASKSTIIFLFLIVGYCYEIFNLKKYYNYMPFTGNQILERNINFIIPNSSEDIILNKKTLMSGETIVSREVLGEKKLISKKVIDYQNPISPIFPTLLIVNYPKIDKIIPKSLMPHLYRIADLYFDPATYHGTFFKNIFLERVLNGRQIYELRHKSYKNLNNVQDLHKNMNTIDFVRFEDKKKQKYQYINDLKTKKKIIIDKEKITLLKKNKYFSIYKIKNDIRIPNYLNTNIFNLNNNFEIKIENLNLEKVQGHINSVYQFDVNNIKSGFTFISLPNDLIIQQIDIYYFEKFFVKKIDISKSNYLFSINTNNDELYLVLRFPYDENWLIKNNNKKVDFFPHENKWLTIKLNRGENNLVLKYNLNKYYINNLTIIFYFISQLILVCVLLLFNNKKNSKFK